SLYLQSSLYAQYAQRFVAANAVTHSKEEDAVKGQGRHEVSELADALSGINLSDIYAGGIRSAVEQVADLLNWHVDASHHGHPHTTHEDLGRQTLLPTRRRRTQ